MPWSLLTEGKAVTGRFTGLAKHGASLLACSFADDLCIVEYRAVMIYFFFFRNVDYT